MKVLARILDKTTLLWARFTDGGEAECVMIDCTLGKSGIGLGERKAVGDFLPLKSELSRRPLIVAVSGKGVITKPVSDETVTAVMAAPDKFIRSVNGGSISFMRRSQIDGILEKLNDAGVVPAAVECLPSDEDSSLIAACRRFYDERLKWRNILKPSAEGSALAMMAAKRIQLPIFGIIFCLLAANFVVSPQVRNEYNSSVAELEALRKSAATAASTGGRKQAAIEGFLKRPPYRPSVLSDRIGAAVPDRVTLTELNIYPVLKTIEAGKPVQQRERIVTIRGESPDSEAIARFAASLGDLGIGTVKLSDVSRDKDRALLTFVIEIGL